MAEKREAGYNISDTGNWNVAAEYSKLKVMRPLDFVDHYENIAKFGHDSILEQLENFGYPVDVLKLTGLERLIQELLKLIGNVRFAMKKPRTKERLEELEEELLKILKVIPSLYKTVTNRRRKTKEIVLHKVKYEKVLKIVLKIKSKLNKPLNRNHLIFTDKETFDPQAYKEKIVESATTRG